jgi:hypothetical protein
MIGVDGEVFQNSFKTEYRVDEQLVVIRLQGRELVIRFNY